MRFLPLLAVLAGLGGAVAWADPAPVGWRYDVYWRGVPVGEGTYARAPTADGYSALWSMETEGLVAGFLSLDTLGVARGVVAEGGRPVPQVYRERLETGKRRGEVVVDFGPPGQPVQSVTNSIRWTARPGPNDRDPPPVPESLRKGLDPASAMVEVANRVRDSFHGGEQAFVLPVYDGVRRFDLKVRVDGRTDVTVWWKTYPAIALVAEIVPLAGFQKPEKWQDRPIRVHLDPETMLPRRVETADGIILTADARCETVEACRG